MAVSVKIDDELKQRVRQLAHTRQRSAHWIMREAIEQYVEREEARESFKQEALASWQAWRETGRHVTAEEAVDWLQGWGTEEEEDAPGCHG